MSTIINDKDKYIKIASRLSILNKEFSEICSNLSISDQFSGELEDNLLTLIYIAKKKQDEQGISNSNGYIDKDQNLTPSKCSTDEPKRSLFSKFFFCFRTQVITQSFKSTTVS